MQKAVIASLALCCSLFGTVIIDNPTSDVINVNLSNQSVNRIVLPTTIIDVAFSKEKGIDIKVTDNQAFIKFLPVQKEKVRIMGDGKTEVIGEPEVVYDKAQSSEIFFVTANKTYSFAVHPKDMEAETVIINDFGSKKNAILAYESDDPYISTMSKIISGVLKGGSPQGYKAKKVNNIIQKTDRLATTETMRFDGVLYGASLLEVENKTDQPIVLNAKDYIIHAIDTPKAIAIYYDNEVNHLLPYSKAQVVIVTKGGKDTK